MSFNHQCVSNRHCLSRMNKPDVVYMRHERLSAERQAERMLVRVQTLRAIQVVGQLKGNNYLCQKWDCKAAFSMSPESHERHKRLLYFPDLVCAFSH